MHGEQAALIRAARETGRAARYARERAQDIRRSVELDRARLGGGSLDLRSLAVRQLLARRAPDAVLWVDLAVRRPGQHPTRGAGDA